MVSKNSNESSSMRQLLLPELELRKRFDNFNFKVQSFVLRSKEATLSELLKKTRTNENYLKGIFFGISRLNFTKFKFTLLAQTFMKFLRIRCPSHNQIQNETIILIILDILIFQGGKNKDFEPKIVWNLLGNVTEYHNYHEISRAQSMFLRDFHSVDPIKKKVSLQISLFGEFLYFISIMHTNSDSPMVQVRKCATEVECLLIDEISMNVTPKLAILTFIVYRHYGTFLNNIIVNHLLGNKIQCQSIYPNIHSSYVSIVKELRQIPLLNGYFVMFLYYLCKAISHSTNRFIDLTLIKFKTLDGLQDDSFLVVDSDFVNPKRRVVVILRNVAEILLFLHKEHGVCNFKMFKLLPEYLATYVMPKNIKKGRSNIFKKKGHFNSVEAVVLAISLLLDFFFIENWGSDVTRDYVTICNKIKTNLETQNEALKAIVMEAALFPFV